MKLPLTVFLLFVFQTITAQTTIPTDYYGINAWMPDSSGMVKYYGKLDEYWNDTQELTDQITTILATIPGDTGDDYQAPSTMDLDIWEQVLKNLWEGNYANTQTLASSIFYDLTTFTDASNQLYYILESRKVNGNHWGTFVFNPNACQSNLIIQAPHPLNDLNTGKQGIYIFEQTGASFYMVAGTHRCNNAMHSDCSGTTSTCDNGSEPFRISDMAHTDISFFHRTTEFIWATIADPYFIQLHGFAKGASDPYLILSNTTTIAPQEDLISQLGTILSTIDPVLDYKVAHIDTDIRLKGTTNTQGRLINGSADACEVAATQNVGRFFHVEQAYDRLRNNETSWAKMGTALNTLFRNIEVDKATIGTSTYKAKDSLSSMTTINATEVVEFRAGECIQLAPGFEAKAGSDFLATIDPCILPPMNLVLPKTEKLLTTQKGSSFVVFPNPVKEAFTIQIEMEQTEERSIYLYDLLGRLIQQILPSTLLSKGKHQIQTSLKGLPNSTYFVVVVEAQRIEVERVVIQNNK